MRWGILSTANIAEHHFVPALQASAGHEVVAVGSRDASRARSWADSLSIATAHGSYEALLADPEVESVYIPLPNHLHVDWSIAALEAGKHVLCEKPLGLDRGDAQRLADAAAAHPDLVTMEAFMYRFHPQWSGIRDLVLDGRIGELRTVQTFFGYFNDDPANVRHRPEWGGGALMDIGCYPISQARWMFGAEPSRVLGHSELDPQFGTDRMFTGILDFGDGATASFTVATQVQDFQRAQLIGSAGRIEVDIPVNAPGDEVTRVNVSSGSESETLEFGPADQYGAQADAFAAAARAGTPAPTPLSDALANMAVIDALAASAERQEWTSP